MPHGVAGRVLYDLGDYRVDPRLRNDLGLLFLVTLDGRGPIRLEALPLKLEYSHTRLAAGENAAWMRRRFRSACADLGTSVVERRKPAGCSSAGDSRRSLPRHAAIDRAHERHEPQPDPLQEDG